MSKVKYRVREYIPKTSGQGTHSWFAEVVINNDVENAELAKKIAAQDEKIVAQDAEFAALKEALAHLEAKLGK